MTPLDRFAAHLYACAYDATVSGFAPYERLVAEVAHLVERGTGGRPARVLDVACGTGSVARRLARRGHHVTGIDVVPGLVHAARQRIPAVLADRLRFDVGDAALEGPPHEGAFDAVVALHTIYWHPFPERLLEACVAALRPGGHAIVVAYRHAVTVRSTLAVVRRTHGTLAAAGALRWLIPTAAFEALRRVPKRYVEDAELRRLLSRAGFAVRETRTTFLGGVSLIGWARRGIPIHEDDTVGVSSDAVQPFDSRRL
jgi:SAM-dependent methyltransferase